jgi:hypothetical protein
MNISTLNRLAMTVAISAVMAAISFASHAQSQPQFSYLWESEQKQDKQDEKDNKKAHQQQQRLSKEQQHERIRQQQENLKLYRKNIELRQAIARQNAQLLQQQKRLAHYRFQQTYYERLRQQQAQLPDDRYDFNNDPFYYTAPNYRYRRDGRSYETNQYGADMLRQASNTGYQQGLQAGRADKQDNWRFDYKQSFAYEDANYGYDGRYVRQDDYNHYFREGFQRGYEDGYYDRRQYGSSTQGTDSLLGTVLNAILNLESMQ